MSSIAFYVSGHGLGHASRQIEIINALTTRRPDCDVRIKSSAPTWLFSRTLSHPDAPLISESCDPGIVQLDSLRLDAVASIGRAVTFYANLDARAAAEATWLEAIGAALVVADTPPLACLAAARAGIPAFVVGNSTWDWIWAGASWRRPAGGGRRSPPGPSCDGADMIAERLLERLG